MSYVDDAACEMLMWCWLPWMPQPLGDSPVTPLLTTLPLLIAVQRQNTVTAHFSSEQLPRFDVALQQCTLSDH